MSAYYNEIEPYTVQWLRNLVSVGHIADGVVDARSILDVQPKDVMEHGQAHFFAGLGGWSHALRLAGWPDDVSVWTGSCPCQPFSTVGQHKGTADERHLWPAWFRLIRECRPAILFGEQVASPDAIKWFDAVSSDLESEGYTVGAADLCAAGVGAPHIRQRLYFVAIASVERSRQSWSGRRSNARTLGAGAQGADDVSANAHASGAGDTFWSNCNWLMCRDGKARPVEPGSFPLAHGVSDRVGKLRAYGNAIVAPLAATFIRAVMGHLSETVET